MPTSKSIDKIRGTFGDGSVTVVDPSSEHPIILLLDCSDDIAHVVSGKISALVKFYWAIGQEYPGQGVSSSATGTANGLGGDRLTRTVGMAFSFRSRIHLSHARQSPDHLGQFPADTGEIT
jgi:deferrochelatase/peroxidase EfeB